MSNFLNWVFNSQNVFHVRKQIKTKGLTLFSFLTIAVSLCSFNSIAPEDFLEYSLFSMVVELLPIVVPIVATFSP